MDALQIMKKEAEEHLRGTIIPFWEKLTDRTYGGYYGYMGYDLAVDEKAEKDVF